MQMQVDPPETNNFETTFSPWPLRWFLVERGLEAGKPAVLLQKALPFNGTYDFAEVDKLLRERCADAPSIDAPPMPKVGELSKLCMRGKQPSSA
ncbi:hypothetical protein DUNSADRAFT_957 [Dunaliella salina]|uniref:Uncharacterized protein n=1 Tax=Dunaliella salina TaxID=3046 RepID=A0ABQ7GXP9_DUNSA|nr:hypothetical protein DUNSADRAFT_957 [Dunaliella salina]|eukprot:KAF5839386.1 hypothetical protein DUNSADRAFT_957 [Dunaliella salina]